MALTSWSPFLYLVRISDLRWASRVWQGHHVSRNRAAAPSEYARNPTQKGGGVNSLSPTLFRVGQSPEREQLQPSGYGNTVIWIFSCWFGLPRAKPLLSAVAVVVTTASWAPVGVHLDGLPPHAPSAMSSSNAQPISNSMNARFLWRRVPTPPRITIPLPQAPKLQKANSTPLSDLPGRGAFWFFPTVGPIVEITSVVVTGDPSRAPTNWAGVKVQLICRAAAAAPQLKETVPSYPFTEVRVISTDADCPRWRVILSGFAVRR